MRSHASSAASIENASSVLGVGTLARSRASVVNALSSQIAVAVAGLMVGTPQRSNVFSA